MHTDKDDEFLLWIANRLVYKYGENPEIVNKIISIIAKNRVVRSSYTEGNKNTVIVVNNTIKYLENLQNLLRTQHQSVLSKLSEPKIITKETGQNTSEKTNFDNIDIESLIRGN
jgi:hypothetical protein